MNNSIVETTIYNDEDIDIDDIPEITDFSNAIKNPFADKLKNGYKVIVHHNSPDGTWDEIIEVTPEEIEAENIKREEFRKQLKQGLVTL